MFLVVSDVHYDNKMYRGVDQRRALDWLLSIVDLHRPSYILSAGDWGTWRIGRLLSELASRATVYTIYGNHEDMEALRSARNTDGTPVLMEDGKVYTLEGLRIAGLSGLVSKRRRRRSVPRKTPHSYLEAAQRLAGQAIDVLLIHEAPYLPGIYPFMQKTIQAETALRAIEAICPRLVVNGHMHVGYAHTTLDCGSTIVHIDSSQAARYYLTLEPTQDTIHLRVWRDTKPVEELHIPRQTASL